MRQRAVNQWRACRRRYLEMPFSEDDASLCSTAPGTHPLEGLWIAELNRGFLRLLQRGSDSRVQSCTRCCGSRHFAMAPCSPTRWWKQSRTTSSGRHRTAANGQARCWRGKAEPPARLFTQMLHEFAGGGGARKLGRLALPQAEGEFRSESFHRPAFFLR